MPKKEVKNKKEAYDQLAMFLGEETANRLIGGIAEDLKNRNQVIIPMDNEQSLILIGPTKEKKAKERRRMYAYRKKRGNKSTKGGKNA